jgi:large subunit ribosomal protein L3
MKGIIGRKLRMSQLFLANGNVEPVTVIQAGPCVVVQRKTLACDGYEAVQLGLDAYENANKPKTGHFQKNSLKPMKVLREFRVGDKPQAAGDEPPVEYKVGDEVKADIFAEGEIVAVIGLTKGRGFAGGMKRWGWHGGPASHGSMSHRRIGSVGSNTYPGRPWRGRTLPGRYGSERVTVKNLKVIKVDPAANLLYVRGAVPGAAQGVLLVHSIRMPEIVVAPEPKGAKAAK